jgi:hypothetical protein
VPAVEVVAVVTSFVLKFFSVTVAFETIALLGSKTVPETDPVVYCARAGAAPSTATTKNAANTRNKAHCTRVLNVLTANIETIPTPETCALPVHLSKHERRASARNRAPHPSSASANLTRPSTIGFEA